MTNSKCKGGEINISQDMVMDVVIESITDTIVDTVYYSESMATLTNAVQNVTEQANTGLDLTMLFIVLGGVAGVGVVMKTKKGKKFFSFSTKQRNALIIILVTSLLLGWFIAMRLGYLPNIYMPKELW